MIRKYISIVGDIIARVAAAAWVAVDLRDAFVFGGLGIMGYGLYQFRPWVAYTVCGAILLAIGMFIGRGKG